MKKFYFLFFLTMTLHFSAHAQNRYYNAMFGVTRTPDVVYGNNISVLPPAGPLDLKVDVYSPVGDTKTDRPLILIAHTGSFLPFFINGQITGSRSDSTVVRTALYFASRGFVVGAFTYRQGWNPTATDQDVRTSTLLQAAYRGIQDTRSCIRYFKKTVAEDGNKYGIDPGKICVWGIGTGGYLAMGAGSLNDFSEVVLEKFIDSKTALPYIDSTLWGNIYGTTQATYCLPNHPNYSSNFQMSMNLGGALGDSTWIDGEAIEPAFVGVHCSYDLFAPYYEGPVIVPTTGDLVIFATGTRKGIEQANKLGSNDILKNVDPVHDPLHNLIEAQKQTPIGIYPSNIPNIVIQGTDNFYGLNLPIIFNGQAVPQGSPWEWWDLNTLRVIVPIFNSQVPPSYQVNADTLHINGLKTNPDMSAAKGLAYLDTIFALGLPRLCAALQLGCTSVGVKEVDASEIHLEIMPMPAKDHMSFKTNSENPMKSIYVYDLKGNLVKAHVEINASSFDMPRNQILSGFYLAQISTKDKMVTKQIIFQD